MFQIYASHGLMYLSVIVDCVLTISKMIVSPT